MIRVAFAFTFAIALPMLPVVSARKQTSGRGAIIDVVAILVKSNEWPGWMLCVTLAGSRPCANVELVTPDTSSAARAPRHGRTHLGKRSFMFTPIEL